MTSYTRFVINSRCIFTTTAFTRFALRSSRWFASVNTIDEPVAIFTNSDNRARLSILSLITISTISQFKFVAITQSNSNPFVCFINACNNRTARDQIIDLVNRSFVGINLPLQVLDVVIVVLTRRERSCRTYHQSSKQDCT